MRDISDVHHVDEFEAMAKKTLSDSVYGYVAGGAGLETSVVRNTESLDSIRLLPRVLRDVETVKTSTTILNVPTSYPLILGPSAVQRLADAQGEMATARAANDVGLIMVLSMNSSTAMESVASTGVSFWMQLYFSKDRRHMSEIIRRAEAAGAEALCLTVDHAGFPNRLRELRQPLEIEPELEFPHLPEESELRRIDRSMNWDIVEWIRDVSTLPLVLKGVLHREDARLASDKGVDAVVVSNHGGRQLDGVVSAYDVLPSIVELVGDTTEVYADGGIRSGSDLLKVLALGAKAGLLGRPVWWSLAAAGEPGVRRMLEILTVDLEEAMRMCGISHVEEASNEILYMSERY